MRFRIVQVSAGGMTLKTAQANPPLLPGAELDFGLHLACLGVERGCGRLTWVRRDDVEGGFQVGVAWIAPTPALLKALSRYLLAGDESLTPATLRAGGLTVGSLAHEVTYDYATSDRDYEEILALRLRAHQAEGHLLSASVADMRSSFDAHARHLVCRFGRRIVGYARVNFVHGDPSRSQYVAAGGHRVPQWLWDAGFVEGGAAAVHPDFQRAGLFVPLVQHTLRVAVQSGHRFLLAACDEGLLGMYREMGFETLEARIVEPTPGWRFRSHLIYFDAERVGRNETASRSGAAMAAAVAFAGLRPAA